MCVCMYVCVCECVDSHTHIYVCTTDTVHILYFRYYMNGANGSCWQTTSAIKLLVVLYIDIDLGNCHCHEGTHHYLTSPLMVECVTKRTDPHAGCCTYNSSHL